MAREPPWSRVTRISAGAVRKPPGSTIAHVFGADAGGRFLPFAPQGPSIITHLRQAQEKFYCAVSFGRDFFRL